MGSYRISMLKTNFDVLYFTQFSIFLKKIKNIGCNLFITTLQPLELALFQFHK